MSFIPNSTGRRVNQYLECECFTAILAIGWSLRLDQVRYSKRHGVKKVFIRHCRNNVGIECQGSEHGPQSWSPMYKPQSQT